MKKLILAILLFCSFGCFAQTVSTSYVVPTVSAMKSYFGNANRMHVTANNNDYVICSPCTPDEVNIYAGAGGRKWMKVSDSSKADGDTIKFKSEVLNVKYFGAVGDSLTDDTQPIQNALDSAKKLGGAIVYFPQGIYRIRRTLWIPNNTKLKGASAWLSRITFGGAVKSMLATNTGAAGTNTITVVDASAFNVGDAFVIEDSVNFEWASTKSVITNITGNIITIADALQKQYFTSRNAYVSTAFPMLRNDSSGDHIIISGISLNQNQNTSAPKDNFTLATIHWVGCYNCVVENSILTNACTDAYSDQAQDGSGSGFNPPIYDSIKTTKNWFRDNIIWNSNRHGVHLGTIMNGAYILNNTISNCQGMALFYCAWVTNTIADGNLVENCAKGFAGGDSRDSADIITNNVFRNIGSAAYTIEAGSNAIISNNQIKNSTRGILDNYSGQHISNNFIEMYGGDVAIKLVNADKTVITGNTLKGMGNIGAVGLYISGSNDVRLSNNIIDSFYNGVTLINDSRLVARNTTISNISTNQGWIFATTPSTDVNIDLTGTSALNPVVESVVPIRAVYNNLGTSWTVNPSYSTSQWHLDSTNLKNRVYDGIVVRWNDGVEHAAIFRDSIGWKEFAFPNTSPIFTDITSRGKVIIQSNGINDYDNTTQHSMIFATGTGTNTTYPFNENGDLVIMARKNGAQRDVIIAAGNSPALIVYRDSTVGIDMHGTLNNTDSAMLRFGYNTNKGLWQATNIKNSTLLTYPQRGLFETDPLHLYYTDSSGTRKRIAWFSEITGGGGGSAGSSDSLKKLPVDTSLRRNNYLLAFDSLNHKWFLAAPGSGGDGTGANPTASIGLTAVNGTASTFLRSDAAPAIDQTITPTWTGLHTFNGAAVINAPTSTIGLNVRGSTGQNIQSWNYASNNSPVAYVNSSGGIFSSNAMYSNVFKTNDGAANNWAIITGTSPNYTTTFGNASTLAFNLTTKSGGTVNSNSKIYYTANPTMTAADSLVATDKKYVDSAITAKSASAQTTLVAGTKAITVAGVTSSSIATLGFVSIGGTVSTTWQYAVVCTANTITISALNNSGGVDTSDTSTLNYSVVY
ncbi:MAG: glycosyl hydrolase family 28-related protein [Ginsengibacter sp.]